MKKLCLKEGKNCKLKTLHMLYNMPKMYQNAILAHTSVTNEKLCKSNIHSLVGVGGINRYPL